MPPAARSVPALVALVVALAGVFALAGCTDGTISRPRPLDATPLDVFAAAYVDGTWQATGLPDRIRPTGALGPIEDDGASWYAAVQGCLGDRGLGSYSLIDDADPGARLYGPDGDPVDDRDPLVTAYSCVVAHPPGPHALFLFLEDDQRYLVDYWERWSVPCLRSHGHRVDPPLRATWFMDERPLWNPYNDVLTGEDPADFSAALAALEHECGPYFGELADDLGITD